MDLLRKLEYYFRLTKILFPVETGQLIPGRGVILKKLRLSLSWLTAASLY